ncbi:lysostaphin resistance A-like protein [Sphingorhabdus sp.]|jgi:membrane protease YdiL (CAAX protease family)|uniref:lysostaphin resistance A-like protein n=1 Tax=Sphingorhabdus sp. TaxID=1902408 RepID=UPI0037C63ED1
MQLGEPAPTIISARPFYPGLLPTIGFIISYFALQGVCTAIIIAATQGDVTTPAPMSIISGLVVSAVAQLMLMWLYLRKDGRAEALGLYDFGRMPLHKATGLAISLVIAAMAFNFVYANYVIPGVGMQDNVAKMLAGIKPTPLNMAVMFFAMTIAAPVVEELLFRGLLQNALAKYMPVWGAILLSSFLFALVHLQLYAIPALMSLSIAFGYLYHRTGSLRTNIILHIANNVFALVMTQFVN